MWASNWYLASQTVEITGAILVTELEVEMLELDYEIENEIAVELIKPIEAEIAKEIEVELRG